MRNREEKPQQRPVSNLRWIVGDLDRLGVACRFGRHLVVGRGRSRAAGVPGIGLGDAFYLRKDSLGAPEAAARKDSFFQAGVARFVLPGRGDRLRVCGGGNGHLFTPHEENKKQSGEQQGENLAAGHTGPHCRV